MTFGKVRGKSSVMLNMERKLEDTFRATEGGMTLAVAFLEGKMKEVTPVDTGNLINSYRRNVEKSYGKVKGRITNVARYGLYVHEMPSTTNFKKPGATNKFMERPLFENQRRVFEIIRKYAEVR